MTASSHLSDNLKLLAHETGLLVTTAASLDDKTIRQDSLCPGWTRAHVLSHLARNADALGNLVGWAKTGTPVAMYESLEAREADIETGSTRDAAEILADLESASARFASRAAGLSGPPEICQVETRAGNKVRGAQLPTLRLLEVVFHHVDLNAGYTFAEADPGLVKRAISNAVERMRASGEVPALSLAGDDGETWSIGEDATDVTGSNPALLLWLARGDESGVSSKAALAPLPAWG
jgi:maleylpyruvate isomerase